MNDLSKLTVFGQLLGVWVQFFPDMSFQDESKLKMSKDKVKYMKFCVN